jgi:hypothetical protein
MPILPAAPPGSVPIIHTTDLYDPPIDPDDHVDLLTLFALREYDIKAVILDMWDKPLTGTLKAGDPRRDPGFTPVTQLAYLTGRVIPVAVGPYQPLKSPQDTAADRPAREQAGVNLLLRALRDSPIPVVISVLGSSRLVTAAFNRDPQLLKEKVKTVLLNAGTSTKSGNEYNVRMDPSAYAGLLRSGLPVDWFPCWTEPAGGGERDTFWRISHQDLFRKVPPALVRWFTVSLIGTAGLTGYQSLYEQTPSGVNGAVMAGTRSLWSTASLVMAAGRKLAKTSQGWRFVPADAAVGLPQEKLELEPINLEVDDSGAGTWSPAPQGSHIRLFHRNAGPDHVAAMTEALNALLRELKVE